MTGKEWPRVAIIVLNWNGWRISDILLKRWIIKR